MLFSFTYELLLSGVVHLLGGGVYLLNLIILSMFFKCGFEVLMCEIKL